MDQSTASYVGIDVAKDTLDIHVLPSAEAWTAPRTTAGLDDLARRLLALAPALVVLEASGGYEASVAAALATAGLPVAVVNPRQVRDFAKALGRLAKTDRLDAAAIALFAERLRPTPRPLPDAAAQALAELVDRRRQLVDMATAERNRRQQAQAKAVQQRLDAHLAWLQREIGRVEADLDDAIRRSPLWQQTASLLDAVPGIGPTTLRCLIADLPELGQLSRRKIAALVGLAPINHDSGTLRGARHIRGGRAAVRTALYMAALVATRHNPTLRAFYDQLLARGKARKAALTACMRKLLTILNAILRDQKPWKPA